MAYYICRSCGNSFEAHPDEKGMILCACCGDMIEEKNADKPLPAGTMINGYEIIRHLASGGEGDVYLAEQRTMERKVALKLLAADKLDSESIEHFFEEARNGAKFENSHMVSVLDVGSADGYCYIASRYVDGETLEAMLARGHSFSEEESLRIVIEVAGALSAVWDKNKMFHRDIKPGNIMLSFSGDVMILDMGIAQKYGESSLCNGIVEGSPYYMSPEHTRGENLSWSTDLYSLGTTLYQMICGCYPYDADTVEEILEMHNNAPFPEVKTRAPHVNVSPKVEALLKRMMGKTPAQRFTSWKEFLTVACSIRQELHGKNIPGSEERSKVKKEPEEHSRNVFLRQFWFLCFLTFLLISVLCTGLFLYLAGRTNSRYADQCLFEASEIVREKNWRAKDLEDILEQFKPVILRFGVNPSVRRRFALYKEQAAQRSILEKNEETALAKLDMLAANVLVEIRDGLEKARLIPLLDGPYGKNAAYQAVARKLLAARGTVHREKIVLPYNLKRKSQIIRRLNIAVNAVYRERFRVCSTKPVKMKPARKNVLPVRKKSAGAVVQKKGAAGKIRQVPPSVKKRSAPRKTLSAIQRKQKVLTLTSYQKRQLEELLTQTEDLRFSVKNPFLKKIRSRNVNFRYWNSLLGALLAQGRKFYLGVYDSGKRYSDCSIRVSGMGKTLKVWSIHKDRIYFRNEPVMLTFSRISPGDWYDFLREVSRLEKNQNLFEAYLLLSDHYLGLDEKQVHNPLVRRLLPAVRKLQYEIQQKKKNIQQNKPKGKSRV